VRGVEQRPALYDRIIAPIDAVALGRWRRQLFGSLRGAVLELGVGTGRNMPIYGPDARVTALDVERDLLLAARKRGQDRVLHLALADAQRLPFPNATFDYVTSTLVFCSIPDPLLALVEVARVLRPGGRLIQIEHTRTNHALPDAGLNAITPLWTVVAGGCDPTRDTAALLDRSGWNVKRHERHAGGLIRLMESLPPE
jgi:ubiquinone/menaquinone biosynthesis C-methylase UbiE